MEGDNFLFHPNFFFFSFKKNFPFHFFHQKKIINFPFLIKYSNMHSTFEDKIENRVDNIISV